MINPRNTAGLAAALVLVALSPSLVLASPASADGPGDTEVAIYLAGEADTGVYGVFRRPTAGGTPVQLVAPNDDAYRDGLAVSQDGSRYAYLETDFTTSETGRARVVVRDVNGPFKRAVVDQPASDDQFVYSVALSPDARTVVWSTATLTDTGLTFALRRASVFGGAATVVPGGNGLFDPTFVSPTTLMSPLINADLAFSGVATLPLAGGTPVQAVGAPFESLGYRLSPSGTDVLFETGTETSVTTSSAPFSLTGGQATIGTPTVIATGPADYSPAWRRDSAGILFTRAPDEDSPGDLWQAAVSGEPVPSVVTETAQDEFEVVVGNIDATAPGAVASASAATLAGTSASIPLDAYPADTDWSGTYVRRTAGGVTRTTLAPVSARVVDTGMAVGTTYSYTFAAVDSSGNIGAWSAPRLVTATAAPTFTTADPTSTTSVRASFPVTLSAVNAPGTYYSVSYGRNGGPGVLWFAGLPGNVQTFGSAAGPNRAATSSVPGSTYRFRGIAYDLHGNATAEAGTARHAVVPFDQGSMTAAGPVQTVARTGAYGGTTLFLKSAGAQAGIRVAGNRVQVIGERGTGTGRFFVYDNGAKVATVDTRATSRQVRQVLYARTLTTTTNHTIVVRAEGTAGRPTVVVDGLSTRRS